MLPAGRHIFLEATYLRKCVRAHLTREIRPSGIIGGHGKRSYGGTVNPPRNRKGGAGNPPPTAGAPEFYPNRNRLAGAGFKPPPAAVVKSHGRERGRKRSGKNQIR